MHIDESFFNEIDQQIQEKSRKMHLGDWTLKKALIVFALLLFVLWHSYNVLLGANSFYVVEELEDRKKELTIEIYELRKENEKLQKKYFNLKLTREDESEY
ncbi:hypothetical protein ThvES_00017200 [Thiovulum sp. ES]|nr:hypothetical protein ThvES_00017200 [Thiovulum sp. ES]